jgi:ribosomal protein S18 acetylase RimI-like enzyme
MSVTKTYRRNGFARVIISELEQRAMQNGCKRIVLETNKEWHAAIKFYRSNGYIEYVFDERQIHMDKMIRR